MPKTIFVTGGAGYIGSHCVKRLAEEGYEVLTFDNLSEGHKDMVVRGQFVEGDLANEELVREIFNRNSIDAVIHFAASCKVAESVEDPGAYYQNNVVAGLVLLREMLDAGIKNLVFSSSAAVYGDPLEVPIPEDHPKRPKNPYGRTKWLFEQILEDYSSSYGLNSVSLRYFNAAGSDPSGEIGELHDPETHLIPIVLEAASGEREKVTIFGTDYSTRDGTCIRDFIHVSDLAEAHLKALEDLVSDHPGHRSYNLGLGQGYSVREVIETCREVTGKPIEAVEGERRPGDPPRLIADPSRAKRDLDWQPEIRSLSDIVDTAWAWHRSEKRKKYL